MIPKTQEITINSFSWERSIDIEKYQTVEESDWSLPSNARLQYSQKEFYGYQDVLDHYETRSRQVAKERVSAQNETYYINGIDKKGKNKKISLSFEEWNSLEIGQDVKLNVSVFGNGKLIK